MEASNKKRNQLSDRLRLVGQTVGVLSAVLGVAKLLIEIAQLLHIF